MMDTPEHHVSDPVPSIAPGPVLSISPGSVSHSAKPKRSLDRITITTWIVGVLLALSLLIVVVRVVQLQTHPDPRLIKHAPATSSSRTEIARRGDLLDRRGRTLSTSRVGYQLFVDPQIVENANTIAADLGHLLNIDPIVLDKRLQPRLDTRYALLLPLLTEAQVDIIRTANIHGVGLEKTLVLHRPHGEIGAGLIGTMRSDGVGLTGAEYRFEPWLIGQPGHLRYLRDSRRRAMWVQPVDYRTAQSGQNVRLSIDIEIQRIAEQELMKQVVAMNAGGGCVVVLDPMNGELLAVCDVISDEREDIEPYTTDPKRQTDRGLGRNRCVTDQYEPGSTYKPFVWAAATELGLADPEEVLDTHNGLYYAKRRPIHDTHPYDELTWEMVLVKSSNIGMVQIAERLTDRQMQQAIQNYGFGTSTECGLLGEVAGMVTSPANWTHYTQGSVSFGQEIAVTPIQMARAFAAFARDGTLPMLRITADDPYNTQSSIDGQPTNTHAILEQRALSESVALKTRYVMRRVMLEGTGRAANRGAKYRMFGKSGTPQMPDRVNGGYHDDRYIPSFIAGAPLDNPRIVVLCVLEDPDRRIGHYGGAICGPVVRDITNATLEYLGVPSDQHLDEDN